MSGHKSGMRPPENLDFIFLLHCSSNMPVQLSTENQWWKVPELRQYKRWLQRYCYTIMKKKTKIILLHFLLWIITSAIFFLFSEKITTTLFSGFHNVKIWLAVLGLGLFLIFCILLISLIITLVKLRKRLRIKAHS